MNYTKLIQTRISAEVKESFKRYCRENDLKESKASRDIITDFLNRYYSTGNKTVQELIDAFSITYSIEQIAKSAALKWIWNDLILFKSKHGSRALYLLSNKKYQIVLNNLN